MLAAVACLTVTATSCAPPAAQDSPTYALLKRDVLVNADLWEPEPRMLAAGLGFTRILGVPGLDDSPQGEYRVRRAGGTWNDVPADEDPPLRALTSAASLRNMWVGYGRTTLLAGGLPVEFSWPVQPSTVDASDFRVTMSDGHQVVPLAASIFPNFEYNERSTVVLVGYFGNRLDPSSPDARYVVKVEVVEDDTPLHLVGLRDGAVVLESAVGLSYEDGGNPLTAYEPGHGPRLCAAKLSHLVVSGDDAPLPFQGALPNHGKAIWGPTARFRLRVLTTGGFSPDGVAAVLPSDFERFFKLRAEDASGAEVWLTATNTLYVIDGHRLEILGLADLGLKESQDVWDLAYAEDHDNQIDIVLRGDEEAMRRITHVVIPAADGYDPFYNPGGPGNDPTPGVIYTQPGPAWSQPVFLALDDPWTVTWFGEGER